MGVTSLESKDKQDPLVHQDLFDEYGHHDRASGDTETQIPHSDSSWSVVVGVVYSIRRTCPL